MMKRNSEKKYFQLNKVCLAIAVVHWLLSFFTDRFIFHYVTWDFSNLTQTIKTAMTFGAKAVFLLVLIALWQGVFFFIKKADRRFVRNSLIYFGINLFVLLLVWPGIWRMDEFGILNSAVNLIPVFWQNYLTSIFYVFSLMLLPFPAGVIIVQCAVVSLAAGFVITWFEKRFGKWGLLSFIPFLFFPVLDSNLYPMRMSIYAFLELVLLIVLAEKNEKTGHDMSRNIQTRKKDNLFVCIVLAALVTVWRTEAIYYLPFFSLLLWILFAKKWSRKKLVQTICGYLVLSLVLLVPQTVGDKLTSGNQYDLTSVVLPLVPLVEAADASDSCQEELAAIDEVINVEVAVQGAKENRSGISLFWGNPDFQRTEYTDEEYTQFKSAYYRLILKYPTVFLQERFTCFMQSVDLLENTTELFSKEGVPNYETFGTYPLTKPVNETLRNRTICLLEWRNSSDYEQKKTGYSLVYGPFLPIVILLVSWAYCLLRKKWKRFFILSLPLIKVPLIMLTAPSRLFMYYYSLYLIGYVLLFYLLIGLWTKIWKKIKAPIAKTIRYAKRNGIKAAYYAAIERVDHKHTDTLTKKALAYMGCREWSSVSGVRNTENDIVNERGKFGENNKENRKENAKENLANEYGGYQPLISIVVPTYETKEKFLRELLDCVIRQTYSNWELIIADASKSDAVKKIVDEVEQNAGISDLIKYKHLDENKGISENTNAAIDEACGDYIALLDHDDLLTLDALEKMVERLQAPDVDDMQTVIAVYSDEDKCDTDGNRFYEPYFKPDFNLDLLLSNNYICHFLMVRADVMKALKLRAKFDGAQDYDLVLRLALLTENIMDITDLLSDAERKEKTDKAEKADKTDKTDITDIIGSTDYKKTKGINCKAGKLQILHAPSILYHWRCHEESTAINTDSKRYAYDAGREALKDYFAKKGMADQVEVTDSEHLGFYKTTYVPDIFAVRKDIAAVCGRVVKDGIVIASPDHLFDGLRIYSSGYMHRADLYMDVIAYDERALRIRSDLDRNLDEALNMGMKLVYDPELVEEI